MNETTVALVIAVITFLGAVLKIAYPLIMAKFTTAQLTNMQLVAEIAIFGAEQIFKEVSKGEDKKTFVIKYIKTKFPKMTDSEINLLIEATGKAMGIFKEHIVAEEVEVIKVV